MNDRATPQATATPQAPRARKAYHAPKLEDYGQVRDLTQATINLPGGADNGLYISGIP